MPVESLTLCKNFCFAKCGARPAGTCLIPLHRKGLTLAQWWRCPPSLKGFRPSRARVSHGYQHSLVISLNKREHWLFILLRSPQESQRGRCKMAKFWLLPNPEQNSHWLQWTQLFILRFQGWDRLLNILSKTPMSNHSSTHHPQICSWATVVPSSPCPWATQQQVRGRNNTSLTPHSLRPMFLFIRTQAMLFFAWQRYLLIMDGRLLVSETSLSSPALNVSGSKEPMHALRSSSSG